jgi:hypothetical protein
LALLHHRCSTTEEPFQGGLAQFQEVSGEDKEGIKVTILENYQGLILSIYSVGEGIEAQLKDEWTKTGSPLTQ